MKDIFGVEVELGDYICYSVRQGDTAAMKHGKVLELKEYTPYYSDTPKIKIRIGQRRDDFRKNTWYGNSEKDGWIEEENSHRWVVIEKAMKKEIILDYIANEEWEEERHFPAN